MQKATQQAQATTPTHASREQHQPRISSARQALPVEGYAGNQATLRRLSRTTPHLQCKLQIGAVNDPLEAEADRVAEQVMRMPDPALSPKGAPQVLRRKCAACEDEEAATLHRKSKPDSQSEGYATASVDEVLRSPGQPLAVQDRAFMEQRFGQDFSRVRIHTDDHATASARDVNALAYATGSHVVFGRGQYAPHTSAGRFLLAHELAHVVQQGGSMSVSSAISPLQRAPATGVIFRSESVHPDEQYCEDLLQNPGTPCQAIIECIEDLIEVLAGRFATAKDEGHWNRIVILHGILKGLMSMALLACKNGEYDQELQDEAQRWRDKTRTTSSPEKQPEKSPEKQPDKSPDTEDQKQTLREKLPSVPNWVWAVIGAAVVALIVACFAIGACEIGGILLAAGEVVGWILINAMRLAGVGLLAQNDASTDSAGNGSTSAAA
jgi:hypothetical protein